MLPSPPTPAEPTQGQSCMLALYSWAPYYGNLLITLNIQAFHISQARCTNFGTCLTYFLLIVLIFPVKGSFTDFCTCYCLLE